MQMLANPEQPAAGHPGPSAPRKSRAGWRRTGGCSLEAPHGPRHHLLRACRLVCGRRGCRACACGAPSMGPPRSAAGQEPRPTRQRKGQARIKRVHGLRRWRAPASRLRLWREAHPFSPNKPISPAPADEAWSSFHHAARPGVPPVTRWLRVHARSIRTYTHAVRFVCTQNRSVHVAFGCW
jgi:hypothetical protein